MEKIGIGLIGTGGRGVPAMPISRNRTLLLRPVLKLPGQSETAAVLGWYIINYNSFSRFHNFKA